MTMMTAITAIPVATLPTSAFATPITTEGLAWNRALSEFRRVEARGDGMWKAWDDAETQLPERPESLQGLGAIAIRGNRENIRRDILFHLCQRDFPAGGRVLYPPERKAEYGAHLDRLCSEADKLTDDAVAYGKRFDEVRRRLRIDELYGAATKYRDEVFFPARNALMAIPAPDARALLAKFEIAATSLEEEHLEGCLADAKRLLA